ncbi:MAG: M18 family aminopeptidase [Lachnospiraceae bacterium]|nr:M18 family aminopeptidase [Lachnospiraceae bacterium]
MYEKLTRELMDFIKRSPSCYHVIDNIRTMLTEHGFEELEETQNWKLQAGGSYFVVRSDSTMIAFKIPKNEFERFQIVASHSDSPSFKIKENEEMLVDGHYVELNTEKYGGMICAPWFDRPLSVAGRVIVRTADGQLQAKLVDLDRDLVMIVNAAIHMNRKVNEGYTYQAQKDMIPLFGDETAKGKFLPMIASAAEAEKEDILGTDLFLYNRVDGTIWGADREYFSSTKLDDLQCAYTSVRALLEGGEGSSVQVCCIFDNEEVGSSTKQGAASTMLSDTLERINECFGRSREQYQRAVAGSFMLSADNAHAVHPNHLDKADPTNRPYMNHGVVIKYNANQKYTTDAVSAAIFKEICRRADVPYQTFANHSDIPGGSTLGNISNNQVSLNTVDIGLAQLAMHSPYETAGVRDTWYLLQAIKAFYDTKIVKCGGGYELKKD